MIKIRDYYIPDTDHHFIEYLKNNEHYQEAQRNRAISFVEDWGFAIDIGANIGLWSKDLSKYFDKLVCFEPNSFCQNFLKKNINMYKSKIYTCALGEKDETKDLFVHSSNSGASSLINRTKLGFKEDNSPIFGEFPKDTPKINTLIKNLIALNLKILILLKLMFKALNSMFLKAHIILLKIINQYYV